MQELYNLEDNTRRSVDERQWGNNKITKLGAKNPLGIGIHYMHRTKIDVFQNMYSIRKMPCYKALQQNGRGR